MYINFKVNKRLRFRVAAAGGNFEHSLNTGRAADIHQPTETFEVLMKNKKSCAKFDLLLSKPY